MVQPGSSCYVPRICSMLTSNEFEHLRELLDAIRILQATQRSDTIARIIRREVDSNDSVTRRVEAEASEFPSASTVPRGQVPSPEGLRELDLLLQSRKRDQLPNEAVPLGRSALLGGTAEAKTSMEVGMEGQGVIQRHACLRREHDREIELQPEPRLQSVDTDFSKSIVHEIS